MFMPEKTAFGYTLLEKYGLVRAVQWHLSQNGPWRYPLSEIYQTAEVTEALEKQVALSSSAVA
jgi:hypothetical protein